MKLIDGILRWGEEEGRKPCLIWNGEILTYQELQEKVISLGKGLSALDMKGKVLAVRLTDPKMQLLYFLAAKKIGAVPLLLHEYLSGKEIADLLCHRPLHGILSDTPFDGISWTPFGHLFWHEEGNGNERRGFAVLTSGSSGLPKVLFRDDESWTDFFPVQSEIFHVSSSSCLYQQGSMAFTGNLNMAMAFLWEGATIVGTTRLFPKTWMKDITSYGTTHVYMIPSKLLALCRVKDKAASVSYVLTGSQLMTHTLLSSLETHFPNSQTILYYGASEMSYVSYIEGNDIKKRPDSVGRPFPGVSISIQEGEIQVKTPYGVQGAKEPMTCHDLGSIDEEGFLHFLGRKEDVYHIKGNHVSKQKVLSHLLMLPGIEEAEMVSCKKENGDDLLVAFLVGKKKLTHPEILHLLEGKLQSWELPTRILWLSKIPRTSTGKTDWKLLEEMVGR